MFNPPELIDLPHPDWGSLLYIFIFFLLAWIVHRLAKRIARRLMTIQRIAPRRYQLQAARQQTLQGLIASLISLLAVVAAILASLSLFVDSVTLVWFVGLFSAGFGLGARPLVSDFLSGVNFIFENTFDVGEKVEIAVSPPGTIEGVVEAVNLRTTLVRSPTGELYTIPNGEIRVVRNFSRGAFSRADITVRIATIDLDAALAALEALNTRTPELFPHLLEPWEVLAATTDSGSFTDITLVARTELGKGAATRPRILSAAQKALTEAGIELAAD